MMMDPDVDVNLKRGPRLLLLIQNISEANPNGNEVCSYRQPMDNGSPRRIATLVLAQEGNIRVKKENINRVNFPFKTFVNKYNLKLKHVHVFVMASRIIYSD
ncbi:hypothetical protein ACOME3_002458 [Neoechinorhynchus agilis]